MSGDKAGFVANLPWRGPRLGSDLGAEKVRVSGAVDPAFGTAYSAALVPFDTQGKPDPARVAFVDVAADSHGWFTLEVSQDYWKLGKKVLVMLVYDACAELREASWDEAQQGTLKLLAGGDTGRVARIEDAKRLADVEDEMRRAEKVRLTSIQDAMRQAVNLRLKHEFKPGLVEFDPSPAPPSGGFTFAVASCQYPARMIDDEVAQASYRRLARRLDVPDDKSKPQFLLLVGDQVYVDATAGFFDPTNEFDRFVHPYYNLFALDAVQDVARRLPTYTMIDDHEIEDDWEPKVWTSREPTKEAGVKAYLKYQRAGGPPQHAPVADSTDPLWYHFESQGISFFIADSRTERSPRTAATVDTAKIMSDGQFAEIERWLTDKANEDRIYAKPKFIATPAPLLPRRRRAIQRGHVASALRSDAWDGYPASLYRLLAHIADNKIRGVVFLSGNEHLSNVVEATITGSNNNQVRILSIHSSGLHAPFPFANACEEDYAAGETFTFLHKGAGPYTCEVKTETFVARDGFALLEPVCRNGKWELNWTFNRADPAEHLKLTDKWEVDDPYVTSSKGGQAPSYAQRPPPRPQPPKSGESKPEPPG